jgi:hypothetical protein
VSVSLGGSVIANVGLHESSTVIQQALDNLTSPQTINFGYPPVAPSLAMPGGKIKLPRGVFKGDLYIGNRGTWIEGEGEGTIIDGSIFVNAGQVRLANLAIIRPLTAAYCLKLSWSDANHKVDRCVIDNVRTTGGDIGLLVDGCILTTFKHCTFAKAQTASGRAQRTVSAPGTNTTLKFIDCGFQDCQAKGLHISQSQNTLVLGCNFEGNTLRDLHLDTLEGVEVIGNNFEDYIDKDGILFVNNNTGPCSIIGNKFLSNYGDGAGTDLYGNATGGTHGPTRAINIQSGCTAGGVIFANKFSKQKGANLNGTGATVSVDGTCDRWRARSNFYSPATLTYVNGQPGGDAIPVNEYA